MKVLSHFLLICLLILKCNPALAESSTDIGDNKTDIVILSANDIFGHDLEDTEETKKYPTDRILDSLHEELFLKQRFQIVDRETFGRAISEKKVSGLDKLSVSSNKLFNETLNQLDSVEKIVVTEVASLAKHNDIIKVLSDVGKFVGAKYLVICKLSEFSTNSKDLNIPSISNKVLSLTEQKAIFQLRIVDVATGVYVGIKSFEINPEVINQDDTLMKDSIAKKAANEVLDIIYPAEVISLEPVTISRGKLDGINLGDIVDIVRKGEEVSDSNHVKLGTKQESINILEITDISDLYSSGKLLNDKPVKLNDLVRIKPTETPKNIKTSPNSVAIAPVKVSFIHGITIPADKISDLGVSILSDQVLKNVDIKVLDRHSLESLVEEKLFIDSLKKENSLNQFEKVDSYLYLEIANFTKSTKNTYIELLKENESIDIYEVQGSAKLVSVSDSNVIGTHLIKFKEKIKKAKENSEYEEINRIIGSVSREVVFNLFTKTGLIKKDLPSEREETKIGTTVKKQKINW